MALPDYGVLAARAIDSRREGQARTRHFHVRLVGDDSTSYRIAVNVKSQESPPDLLYLVDDDLRHPVTTTLPGLASGWHRLSPGPSGPSLDFIRANLFDRADMRVLPPDVAGPDNDLADLLDHHVQRAIGDASARIYAFGQRWGPEQHTQDEVFAFEPGNGVHDIHMNQGSGGQFRPDNGVWQDGGLVMHFASENRWVAIFLAFQGQAWHTDDTTGDALDDGGGADETAAVRIIAATVNPIGPAPEAETVLLLNASPAAVDVSGWRIAGRAKRTCAVPGGPLAPGATLLVPVSSGVALGNNGGAITLLDGAGLKVDGVAYTADDAKGEGWTVVF